MARLEVGLVACRNLGRIEWLLNLRQSNNPVEVKTRVIDSDRHEGPGEETTR